MNGYTEGIAAKYGTAPWYQYLDWGAETLAEAVPILGFILMALGMLRERRLLLVGLFFLIGHSVITRKDARFLWPLVPILLLVFATGFEMVYRWLRNRERVIFVVVFFCCLAGGSWERIEHLNWNPEPSRASSLALARVGRYPDVTGVLIYNLHSAECGNYFYLRRDVPLLVKDVTDPSDITAQSLWTQGKINYLIAWPKDTAFFAKYHLEEVDIIHGLGIYKVERKQAASQ